MSLCSFQRSVALLSLRGLYKMMPLSAGWNCVTSAVAIKNAHEWINLHILYQKKTLQSFSDSKFKILRETVTESSCSWPFFQARYAQTCHVSPGHAPGTSKRWFSSAWNVGAASAGRPIIWFNPPLSHPKHEIVGYISCMYRYRHIYIYHIYIYIYHIYIIYIYHIYIYHILVT